MNPNPDQIRLIQAFVANMSGGWANDDAAIRASMAADLSDNPTPQPQVPVTFTATTVFGSGIISPGSVAKLVTLPSFSTDVIPFLNAPDKTPDVIRNLNTWAGTYFMAGALNQSEFDYLSAPAPGTTAGAPVGVFNQTQPDPGWKAQIPWDLASLGRYVDDFDIETARHA
jgi:hypothetical protein